MTHPATGPDQAHAIRTPCHAQNPSVQTPAQGDTGWNRLEQIGTVRAIPTLTPCHQSSWQVDGAGPPFPSEKGETEGGG